MENICAARWKVQVLFVLGSMEGKMTQELLLVPYEKSIVVL